jgi:hypothetical protein
MMRSASLGLSSQTQSTELDRVSQPGTLTDGRVDDGRLTEGRSDGRVDLQQLLGQFRSSYPMGSLTADLLAIQAEQYIVRANIQAGGTLLATAMAAESSLELAEDRARLRALELIGITVAQSFGQPMGQSMGQQYWPYPNPVSNLAPPPNQPANQPAIPAAPPAVQAPIGPGSAHSALPGRSDPEGIVVETVPQTILDVVPEPERHDATPMVPALPVQPMAMPALDLGVEAIAPLAESLGEGRRFTNEPRIAATIVPDAPSKAKAKGPSKAKAELQADTPIAPPPNSKRFVADWSEELSQIEVELKRLSWSDAQEADYLQRTYGQRSRDYITDFDQLTGYLSYLRALPSHFSPAIEPPTIAPDPTQNTEPETELDPDLDPDLETETITGLGTNFSDPLASSEPASSEPASPEPASPEPVRSALSSDLEQNQGDDDGPPWVDPGPEADLEEFAGPQFPVPSPASPSLAPTLSPESIALANGGPAAQRPAAASSAPSRDEMLDESAAECKRLKWTNRQGSDYLKATYGKPTRKDLNNDDLWDFLQYLRSLSMTSEQLPF